MKKLIALVSMSTLAVIVAEPRPGEDRSRALQGIT